MLYGSTRGRGVTVMETHERGPVLSHGFEAPVGAAGCASVTVWNSPAGDERDGGDWCAAVPLSSYEIALTIGDVSGHGEAVAGTKASLRASILGAILRTRAPSDVLSIANGVAFADADRRVGVGTISTAVIAFFDERRRSLTLANAGHPPPLVVTADRHSFLTQSQADLPLGIFAQHEATNSVVKVHREAIVVFYTDGVTERERDVLRGEHELIEAARFAYARPDCDAARTIADHVFRNGRGLDDAAVMVLRTPPPPIRASRNGASLL